MGILKAMLRKIASWFTTETKAVEARVVVDVKAVEQTIDARLRELRADAEVLSEIVRGPASIADVVDAAKSIIPGDELKAVLARIYAPTPTGAAMKSDINTAIQIALALKAIDPTLSADAVQAATNAALVAAYPAPVAAQAAPAA